MDPVYLLQLLQKSVSLIPDESVPSPEQFHPRWTLISQTITFLAMESLRHIVNRCELQNNLAYNQAELRITLEDAKGNVSASIDTMNALLTSFPSDNAHFHNYKQMLAQYFDSLGWIAFAQQKWEEANKAFVKALRHDQGSAIVYYHMTRVQLTQLEQLWQSLNQEQKRNVPAKESEIVSQHFRDALSHWENAQRLDTGDRLRSQLKWLRQRIRDYQDNWEKTQVLFLLEK